LPKPGAGTLSYDYVVVGAGAIGGTVGARLVQSGRSVLFCDADADHVAAINAEGLQIEGPVEELEVRAPAVEPAALPEPEDWLVCAPCVMVDEGLVVVASWVAVAEPVVALARSLVELSAVLVLKALALVPAPPPAPAAASTLPVAAAALLFPV